MTPVELTSLIIVWMWGKGECFGDNGARVDGCATRGPLGDVKTFLLLNTAAAVRRWSCGP
jgi:hypothetical protein